MADDSTPKPDPTVKQLLERDLKQPLEDIVDAVTAAELQKWFGLPSYKEVEEGTRTAAAEDPEMIAVREQREKAIAAVDPAFLASHSHRTGRGDELLKFQATIELRLDPSVALFERAKAIRGFTMHDPRELDVSENVRDDLHDCTPQALLRDLHRPELEFEKTFELVDVAQRRDIATEIATAMATSWKLPELGPSPFRESADALDEMRIVRKLPWPVLFAAKPLPNRQVRE